MNKSINGFSLSNYYSLIWILSFVAFLAFRATMLFIADEDLMMTSVVNKVSISEAFSNANNLTEFRPISVFIVRNVAYFFTVNEKLAFIFTVLFLGSLISTVSAVIFGITFKITKNIYAALASVFVNLFSTIFLTGSFLYLFAILYILPHLFNILAFFFYLKYILSDNDSAAKSRKYLFYISLCCIIGPLTREAALIAPLTIILCESLRYILYFFKKNITPPSIKSGFLFLLLFLYSIAPKSIFYILGIYDGKITTIFGGEKLVNTNNNLVLNLNRFLQILFEFPTTLWVVFLFGLACLIYKYFASIRKNLLQDFSVLISNNISYRFKIIFPIFLLLLVIFFYSFLKIKISIWLFCIIFLVSFFSINPYLTILAITSLIPPIFIPSNHLIADIFFITPFSITFSIGIYSGYCAAFKNAKPITKLCFIIIIFISVLDFMGNYFSSYISTVDINKSHQEIATSIKDNIPSDAIIITNFFAGRDILMKFNDKQAIYYNENKSLFSYENYKDKKKDMLKKLKNDLFAKHKDIYFLLIKSYNTDYPFYLPHDKMQLVQYYRVHNFFLHLDPLRHFIFNKNFLAKFNPIINFLPESMVYPQYDTSYNNYHIDNCCISSSKIGLYKLSRKDLNSLNEYDFKFERFDNFDNPILEN